MKEDAQDILITALSTPPKEGLSIDFSSQLRRRLESQLKRRNRIRFYFGWTLIFMLTMPVLFFSLVFIDATYHTNTIAMIITHKWLFLIGFPLLLLIQYFDHTSIKEHQLKKMQHQQR